VLDTTIHKTQDEDKQSKKYNTIFVGHHQTQDTRRRQTKQKNTAQYVLDTNKHKTQDEDKQNKKHNTIFVGHHHTQVTRRRQTK
jgi:hypothetical protein